jgi:hypothetical protein
MTLRMLDRLSVEPQVPESTLNRRGWAQKMLCRDANQTDSKLDAIEESVSQGMNDGEAY